MDISVQHDEKNQQFVNTTDGKESVLRYKKQGDNILEYYSTFVPSELRGHQIGEKIVMFALNYARENNIKIIPTCPFVQRILERYPEYKDLVAEIR